MPRRSKTHRAAVALETKKQDQMRESASKRYKSRQGQYDRGVTTTSHEQSCAALNLGTCDCM